MRKGTGSVQISPRRLLSLLLINVFVVFAALAIPGVDSRLRRPFENLTGVELTGGNSLVRTYKFQSRCSKSFLRMRPSKRGVDALGKMNGLWKFEEISLKSVPKEGKGVVKIYSKVINRYICFNKRGYPVNKRRGKNKRCMFHEIPHGRYVKFKSIVKDWTLGFSRSGRRMRGYSKKMRKRSRCSMFIKKQVDPFIKPKPTPDKRFTFDYDELEKRLPLHRRPR